NEPDTTGDESKFRDTWDPTYAPFLYTFFRTANDLNSIYCPGGSGSVADAQSGVSIDNGENFVLADINGGNLTSGDLAGFKTYNKTFLRVSGTSVLGDAANTAASDARFTVT